MGWAILEFVKEPGVSDGARSTGMWPFPLPMEEPLPAQIHYSLGRGPGDLYVSAPEV